MAFGRAVSRFSAVTAALVLSLAACSAETSTGGDSPAAATTPPAAPPPAPQTPAPTSEQPTGNPIGSGETRTVAIDNATGGAIALSDGTELKVPAGALPEGVTEISVTSSATPAPAEYKTISPVYEFGPEGAVFLKPLTISFPVSVPAGTSTSDLTILWSRPRGQPGFDMVPGVFTAVEGQDGKYVVSGEVNHFSRGMCGFKFVNDPNPVPDPYKD